MEKYKLKNGLELVIREAKKKDAGKIIDYVNKVAGETDYLTFGKGEFSMTEEAEGNFIENINKKK